FGGRGRTRLLSYELGWETQAGLVIDRELKPYGLIHYTTGPFGFRVFGDTTAPGAAVFVIGDSNTQAVQVSDGETYYEVAFAGLDSVSLFAYGTGGWGTLQEYLILDRYMDMIRPDLVVWQFASNDIINNDLEIE